MSYPSLCPSKSRLYCQKSVNDSLTYYLKSRVLVRYEIVELTNDWYVILALPSTIVTSCTILKNTFHHKYGVHLQREIQCRLQDQGMNEATYLTSTSRSSDVKIARLRGSRRFFGSIGAQKRGETVSSSFEGSEASR